MKVYGVYMNADMTEGRGPMMLDKVFKEREHANHFIDVQPGVMGHRKKWSVEHHSVTGWCVNSRSSRWTWSTCVSSEKR